tara:strand:+ start:548 stop:766 length:219 start_codon:yes stop_codon:yes gene_type:complete
MTTESVLSNSILLELRNKNIISENEVAIQSGDLYFAKNVLTNEKRMLSTSSITAMTKNESLSENTQKTLLKG